MEFCFPSLASIGFPSIWLIVVWIGLVWLSLNWMLCFRLKSLVSIINTSYFSYLIMNTITFRFDFVIMYMLCLVTIVIWLTIMVLFTYDFRPAQIQFGLCLIWFCLYAPKSWIDTNHNSYTQSVDSRWFTPPCYQFDSYCNEYTI